MFMTPTFFFGTAWIAPIGFIFQTMIVVSLIWFPKSQNPDEEYRSKYIKAIRGIPMALFLFFGVLYIDVYISVVPLALYPPATWALTYPSAFLALVLGIEWVAMAALVSPNVKTIASTGIYIVTFIIYVKAWVPLTRDAWSIIPFLGVMAAIGGVHVAMIAVEAIVKKLVPRFQGDKQLWNVRSRFKRVFNVPVNVVLWVIVTVEAFLQFTGHSMVTILMP